MSLLKRMSKAANRDRDLLHRNLLAAADRRAATLRVSHPFKLEGLAPRLPLLKRVLISISRRVSKINCLPNLILQ